MSVQVRRRRESAAFLSTFVGAQGELLIDTTNNRVQVHDGTTPGGYPAAKLSEVIANTRTAVADANYTALASDRSVAFTALSAARTLTLPSAATYPTGTQLLVSDETGACSATNTITIARSGTDTINGAASATIAAAYGYLALTSNGSAKWTVVDQAAAGVASGSFAPTITFSTPGDLSVSYATQSGAFYQVGKLVFVSINLVFTPTYSTASGGLRIALPFTAASGPATILPVQAFYGATAFAWPATATQMTAQIAAGQAYATLIGSKSSATSTTTAQAAQLASGNAITLQFSGVFLAV